FLEIQVAAGAAAVQLFDSWVGAVGPEEYRRAVLPHASRIFAALGRAGVPRIHFGVGTGELLGLLGQAGADVVGVDWRVPLDEAARRVGPGTALQGNLDPAVLLAPWHVIEERAADVIERGRAAAGHVFNLGHGVLPETDPAVLARLTDLVHGCRR
ncbi:MAG TPA: uroporphyrinogen decarboxylase family protein, partial [Streptosporangiaceae bacterium]|nr:uroporphyrinogen decarboxylase family protein [Streptosporangiaceae bacterium]